jgi:hypothetical protein
MKSVDWSVSRSCPCCFMLPFVPLIFWAFPDCGGKYRRHGCDMMEGQASFRECKAVRAVLLLIGAIALAGCASQQEQQQKSTTAQLDTWIGLSISTVVGAHGPPQATFDLGPNKKMFQWVMTPQSPGFVAPISGMVVTRGPQTQECSVSLTATTSRTTPTLADWRITSYQWAGASC